MNRVLIVALAAGAALSGYGCSGAAARRAAAPRPEASAGPAEAEEGDLRGGGYSAVPELKAVRFDYDSAELSAGAREALRRNADWIKGQKDLEVQIQGHCDERGTVEYNLALGQRRANAVREYYRLLGVPPRRMSTISFGEERPLCSQGSEACWARNRRAESLARTGRGAPAAR